MAPARTAAQWLLPLAALGCDAALCKPDGTDTSSDEAIVNGTCAPEGTLFADSYACERVGGPCAESSGEAMARVTEDPARLADPDLSWSRAQLAACTCSCCHGVGGVADHRWAWNFEPVWTDSADGEALNHLLEPTPDASERPNGVENNGFTLLDTAMPTTDPARMRAFIDRELARR